MGKFKNSKSANASWLAVKKKLLAELEPEDEVENGGPSPVPTTSTGNGTMADDEAFPVAGTPNKKGGRKPKTAVTDPSGEDGKDEAADVASAKKRGRKSKDPNASPSKRVKKEAKAESAEIEPESSGNMQGEEQASIFGDGQNGGTSIKNEGDPGQDSGDEALLVTAV